MSVQLYELEAVFLSAKHEVRNLSERARDFSFDSILIRCKLGIFIGCIRQYQRHISHEVQGSHERMRDTKLRVKRVVFSV